MPENTTHRDTIAVLRDAIGYVLCDTNNALRDLRPDEYFRRDTWAALLDAYSALGDALYATASGHREVFEYLHRADEALDAAHAAGVEAEKGERAVPKNTMFHLRCARQQLDWIVRHWPDLYGPAVAAVSVSA